MRVRAKRVTSVHQTIVAFSFLSERATTLSNRDVNRCATNAFCQNETLNLCSGGGFFC